MITETKGTFTFYDNEGTFIKPDESKTYYWPDANYKITNWTTWMLALSYWLEELFDIEVLSGDGSGLGNIGFTNVYSTKSSMYRQYIEQDNDWASSDLGRYDLPVDVDWPEFQSARAPSPFDYRDGQDQWIGQWAGTEKFDFDHNRFDIILKMPKSSNNFNNLGIRIKYPITCTGTMVDNTAVRSENCNFYYIVPGCVPIVVNDNIQPIFNNYYMYSDYNRVDLEAQLMNTAGYITLLENNYYINRQGYYHYDVINQVYKYNSSTQTGSWYRYGTTDSSSTAQQTFLKWDNIEEVLTTNRTFTVKGFPYNKITVYKSFDDNILNIIIGDNNLQILEFVIFDNTDDSQSILLASDIKQYSFEARDGMVRWQDYYDSGTLYKNYRRDTTVYGTYGNTIISSKKENGEYLSKLFPVKYNYDVRDENYQLIDDTGHWCLELFSPFNGIYSKNLFLVTRCGTRDLLTENGKYIVGTLNNKLTKFYVFPFNSRTLREYQSNDNITMFAIPIEQEA